MPRCDHCLLEFPEREAVYDEIDGTTQVFCCNGCRGIYRLIYEEGLDKFYEKREWKNAGIQPSIFDKEIDIKPFTEYVRDVEDRIQNTEDRGQKEIDIYIDGIHCASCVWLNEKILMKTDGVRYARVNYATHRARIRWSPETIGLEKILKRIASIGYNPKPYSESEQFKIQRAEARDILIRFGTAAFLSSQLMIYSIALYAGYFQGIEPSIRRMLEVIAAILTVPVIFYSGMPFIRNAIAGIRHLNFNMDALITIGAGSAFIYSTYQIFTGGKVYFDTAAMIITLILLGRYIEINAKGRASQTIEMLSELIPKEATVIVEEQEIKTVPISSIKKGDLIRVKPGERIPLDGIVVSGESEVNESIITGESNPLLKMIGNEVIGGSMNLYGTLIFEVTKTGKDTVLSGIIRAVEDAQAEKPRIQRLADRIVGIFVPLILFIALLTVILHLRGGSTTQSALMTGISVLVIACPCSLGLATPIAVLIFTAITTSKGILIRGGEVIENVSRLTHVIFDKTGTVTIGRPVLKEMVVFDNDLNKEYLLAAAASIESLSEHSIGHAITEAAKGFNLFGVSKFEAFPGKGVEGVIDGKSIAIGNRALMKEKGAADLSFRLSDEVALQFENKGDTAIFMLWHGMVKALFIISDMIRDEALDVVRGLKEMNFHISIVSGDNIITTNSIASVINVDNTISEASPVSKKEIINKVQQKGHRVMMVGDGINDAPALTEALVGIAMGRGTDIAMESADAVLVRNDLRLIPYFIQISKKTYSIIKQNIFWAFFYNIVAIPMAMAGILHPIVAAGAMALSSLIVVGNSLRIRRLAGVS
ncbi:MAG: heavy metal translocating P-type ATPase [Thermodesulfovibrionales bacterium]|nr:heavy metal translocating P-type ATPase [Thermodesulfovibrionales bacterium]